MILFGLKFYNPVNNTETSPNVMVGRLVRQGKRMMKQRKKKKVHSSHMLQAQNNVTIMILSFRTNRPGQTVETQIRLLPGELLEESLIWV